MALSSTDKTDKGTSIAGFTASGLQTYITCSSDGSLKIYIS